MKARAFWAICALVVLYSVAAMATNVPFSRKGVRKVFNATRTTYSGGTEYLTGTNAKIYAYPMQQDSAGQGTRCYYLGSPNPRYLWGFKCPKTDVYYFMETSGLDTLIAGMDSVYVNATLAPDTLITARTQIGLGVIYEENLSNGSVTSRKLAAGAISDSTKFGSAVIPLTAFKRSTQNRIVFPGTIDMRSGGDTLRATYIAPVDSATGVAIVSGTHKGWLTVSGLGMSSAGSSGQITRSSAITSYLLASTDNVGLKMPNRAWYIVHAYADSVSFWNPWGDHSFTVTTDSVRFSMPISTRGLGAMKPDTFLCNTARTLCGDRKGSKYVAGVRATDLVQYKLVASGAAGSPVTLAAESYAVTDSVGFNWASALNGLTIRYYIVRNR